MGKSLVLSLGLLCSQLHAAPWFTVAGDSRNPAVDTVDVDPVVVSATGEYKTMNVRVSRAGQRINWDGVPYRSYESQVVFDCRAHIGEYIVVTYYMEPLWRGAPHRTIDYVLNPRPMLFKDMEPNPTERIIRAACGTKPG